ncbi:MAG: hypothetical protein NT016_01015 [Candidatus Aenigmarchaeota archaeon]|nr:hypothetical protein [Candidatus Aenigmarchaeota archaeon]
MNGSPITTFSADSERDLGRGESKDFPVIHLEDAIEIARRVKDLGEAADMATMERVLDIRGGALARKLASTRRWGLIEGKGRLMLTALARDIFFYTKDEQPAAAKMRAFLGVPMFREMYEAFSREGSLPRDDLLRNLIIAKYRLDERDASTVTNIVKRSVSTFIPLLKQSVLGIQPKPALVEPRPEPAPVTPMMPSPAGQKPATSSSIRMMFDAARCLGRMEEMARKTEVIKPTKDELQAVLTEMLGISGGFSRLNHLLQITKEELKTSDIDVLTALKRLKFFSQSLEEDCGLKGG